MTLRQFLAGLARLFTSPPPRTMSLVTESTGTGDFEKDFGVTRGQQYRVFFFPKPGSTLNTGVVAFTHNGTQASEGTTPFQIDLSSNTSMEHTVTALTSTIRIVGLSVNSGQDYLCACIPIAR